MLSQTTKPNRTSAVYMTCADYEELSRRADALSHTIVGQSLQTELERAIMAPVRSARVFVRLGTTVTYEDLATRGVRRLQLCLPEDASLDDQKLSVLTPVGAALIGASVGQVLNYAVADGRNRRLRVLEVDHAA
jgi:regulator of nucleoside diphosphate kinase